MTDRDELERLKALDARIAATKATLNPAPAAEQDHHSIAHIGWRMVIELVSGLGIGFAIGYGLDYLFGTLPLLLVVFTLLGFAAGVKTMLRTARELAPKTENDSPPKAVPERGDDSRG